uniref:two component sensor kinase n=1 Tax=Ahnfeltia fastigiata TaxID=31363 RepID=UPI001D11AD05|nr:two component sensor kinase [Ahnfeltia fastigiata]UAT97527.1 two component sensor kinase [Ahnfeltia fastigiata]UAT97731.1 two component sensor kinase [Ahnfeltia fastigiata]
MTILNKIIEMFLQWWSDVNLTTRLMVVTTLSISLLMSSLTFWALTSIQEDSILTDARFCKDLSLLFSSNIIDLIDQNNQKDLSSFAEKIYLSTSSIRYILFFNTDNSLSFALPVYSSTVRNALQLHHDLINLDSTDIFFSTPVIRYSTIFNDHITDILIPLIKDGRNLGLLELGINPNPSISSASKLTRDVSIAIFVSIWLMVIIGVTFNALTITEPIKELLIGVRSIASGHFSQRIKLPFDGELGDLIVSFNEMAERLESYEKKNVEQLTSEKVKLETLVSTIADGAILVDTELRLLFVNQTAIKVFHWPNKDIIGTLIFSHLPPHVNDALLPVLNNLVKSNCFDNSNYKTQELCIDLTYDFAKTFRLLLTTVLDQTRSNLTGVAITIQDITREAQLNEAKNLFVSNVSHELRTPLCNIGSFLETLLDYHESLSDKQKIHFLNIANDETKRLTRLVNDVLDLSRLESEYNYHLSPVELCDVIGNTIQTSQLIANNNEVKIFFELSPNIDFVFAHESSLLQVLVNLVSNALKFTNAAGSIVIRAYPIPDRNQAAKDKKVSFASVRIEIVDEGIGIDKTDQQTIFDRFVRIENNVHTLEGTGLGLSIVKNIIEKHNSQIFVYSELGVGTSFWFDLVKVN